MAGYIRQDVSNNIADGNIINASDFDNEYNAIEAAFHAVTGHKHDGTSAEGHPITKIGPSQDFVASATALTPKTDNALDLGSSAFEYRDLYIDGTANIDSLIADTADINGGTVDNAVIGGTTPAAGNFTTVDATNVEVTNLKAKDGTAALVITDSTGVITISTQLNVDNLRFDGNNIISTDTNGNIALTPNGTGEVDISKVDIDSGAIDNTVIGANTAAAGTFTSLTSSTATLNGTTIPASKTLVDTDSSQTLTNKTLTSPTFNDGYTEEVFAVTGTTPALSPTNGSIQTWTLSGNSTPTAGTWAAGQSLTLMVDDGTARTITWTSVPVTWKTNVGNPPPLNTSGFTVIQLWKVGTVIYGARVGDA